MLHAFLLVVLMNDKPISKDMYFRSIDRCNYFASRIVRNYGNYQHSYLMPKEHRRTAYCKPVYIDAKTKTLYD